MRHTNEQSLKEVIAEMLHRQKLKGKLTEVKNTSPATNTTTQLSILPEEKNKRQGSITENSEKITRQIPESIKPTFTKRATTTTVRLPRNFF